MTELEPLLQNITALTWATVGLVALAGLIVGIAPSSFPLLAVAAGMGASARARNRGERSAEGPWLAAGFAFAIATVDAVLGALFGLAGFAVMRVLASAMALVYALLGAALAVTGLALLRLIRIAIPVLIASPKRARTFFGSYLVGLPFGLSTCPACTPLILPVVAAAAATGDPFFGAALMFTFGVARGIPIVLAGTVAGTLARWRGTPRFIMFAERTAGVLMLAAAIYFFFRAAVYAGWLTP